MSDEALLDDIQEFPVASGLETEVPIHQQLRRILDEYPGQCIPPYQSDISPGDRAHEPTEADRKSGKGLSAEDRREQQWRRIRGRQKRSFLI